jgi:hypothetical protein
VAYLTLGESNSQLLGGRQGCSRRGDIALTHQQLRLSGMRQGEIGVRAEGVVIATSPPG